VRRSSGSNLTPGTRLDRRVKERLRTLSGRPPPPSSSLLLDALDPDDAEAGVFIAKVRLKYVLFGVECLDRVHISELYENHAVGRRGTAQADRFVRAAGDVLAAA